MPDDPRLPHQIDCIEFRVIGTIQAQRTSAAAFGRELNDCGPGYAGIRRPEGEAGGRIAREDFEFPGGRRFHCGDPCGNELAVWSDR